MDDLKREDLSPLVVNTVFVSSTRCDLDAFRQAVTWLQRTRFNVTESFPADEWSSVTTPEQIVAECRRRVFSADAFILILGPWAGWSPPAHTESITHLEFRWARVRFAELRQSMDRLAKLRNLPELVRLCDVPRILVLTAGPDKRRRERSDGGQALLRIEDTVRPLFAEFTKVELEGVKSSLGQFHQEVHEAVDAHEALLYSFNEMEDMEMEVEVLKTFQLWNSISARCWSLLSR